MASSRAQAPSPSVSSFLDQIRSSASFGLPDRGITEDTCRRFGYMVARDPAGVHCHVAEYYDALGSLVAARKWYAAGTVKAKKYVEWVGEHHSAGFFGQQLWGGGSRGAAGEALQGGTLGGDLVITEGEIDCMTVSQLAGPALAVVSIRNGAGSAKYMGEQTAFLEQFDRVVLMFDMDEPGQDAIRRFGHLLPPGKGYRASLNHKDANDCLMAGFGEEVLAAIRKARPIS